MPKNPTFCTRFWTASLAREAKSCQQENKGINEAKPQMNTPQSVCACNVLHGLGFSDLQLDEFLQQKQSQFEVLGLEGRKRN